MPGMLYWTILAVMDRTGRARYTLPGMVGSDGQNMVCQVCALSWNVGGAGQNLPYARYALPRKVSSADSRWYGRYALPRTVYSAWHNMSCAWYARILANTWYTRYALNRTVGRCAPPGMIGSCYSCQGVGEGPPPHTPIPAPHSPSLSFHKRWECLSLEKQKAKGKNTLLDSGEQVTTFPLF